MEIKDGVVYRLFITRQYEDGRIVKSHTDLLGSDFTRSVVEAFVKFRREGSEQIDFYTNEIYKITGLEIGEENADTR